MPASLRRLARILLANRYMKHIGEPGFVFGAARLHGNDTTVPVLAKMKTRTSRLWTYVRDDRPFGGPSPRT